MDKVKTRKTDICPIFGSACDLESEICLPTKEDVFRCYLFTRDQIRGNSSKQPPEWEVAKLVANKVEAKWKRASLSTVGSKRVIAMILAYHKKYRNLRKPLKKRKSLFILKKVDIFKEESKTLFDISSCKCSSFHSCKCEKLKKVPLLEQDFLTDQRNDRKMRIAGVDKVTIEKYKKKEERLLKDSLPSTSSLISSEFRLPNENVTDSSSSEEDLAKDQDFKWSYSLQKPQHKMTSKESN